MSILASVSSQYEETVLLYSSPSGGLATLNLNIVNLNETISYVSLYVVPNSEVQSEPPFVQPVNTIEHMVELEPGSVLYRTGIILSEGDEVYLYSDSDNVVANAWGVEQLG
jgi:hypothetical protein